MIVSVPAGVVEARSQLVFPLNEGGWIAKLLRIGKVSHPQLGGAPMLKRRVAAVGIVAGLVACSLSAWGAYYTPRQYYGSYRYYRPSNYYYRPYYYKPSPTYAGYK